MSFMDGNVKDIFEVDREASGAAPQLSRDIIMGAAVKEPKRQRKFEPVMKRPMGMNREVYALLYSDKNDANSPSLIPTDTGCGYRQPKARLGRKHVRPWKWMPFTNPARQDNLTLYHWRRAADEGKEYPFAQFNKSLDIPTYTEEEYTFYLKKLEARKAWMKLQKHLTDESWSKDETDHLFELCKMFDLRFTIVQDRYDSSKFTKRSIEDLKERYYGVCNRLTKAHFPSCDESQLIAYDAPHEQKRKIQLERLLNRTKEQVEEEEMLLAELKKIEMRKKEREKKQQDLQKLISAAEQNAESRKGSVKKVSGSAATKKMKAGTPGQTKASKTEGSVVFKSFDKSSGVSLRSNKMKTPMTLGQKKAKMIEQLLEELGVGFRPMPTEQICVQFNELRNDILLLLELKAACDTCEFELQSLRHRYEGLPQEKQTKITVPELTPPASKRPLASGLQIIDVVTTAATGRKRRMATLESPVLKKARKL